jgi:hypothetical protein
MKWIAFLMALLALVSAADRNKVAEEFEKDRLRLSAIENKKCTLMAVLTPSGVTSICIGQ